MQEITFQSLRNSKIFWGSMLDTPKLFSKYERSFQAPHFKTRSVAPALPSCHKEIQFKCMQIEAGFHIYISVNFTYGAAGHDRFQQSNSTLPPKEKGLVSPLQVGHASDPPRLTRLTASIYSPGGGRHFKSSPLVELLLATPLLFANRISLYSAVSFTTICRRRSRKEISVVFRLYIIV